MSVVSARKVRSNDLAALRLSVRVVVRSPPNVKIELEMMDVVQRASSTRYRT